MNSEIKNLLKIYNQRKEEIKKFLEIIYKNKSDNYIFGELCFCLLTPQSRAKNCRDVVEKLKNENKLFTISLEELRKYLQKVRFPNVKAKRIIEIREKFSEIKKNLNLQPLELREWLINNIKGLNLKESAHFMRNIGFKGLPIIDVHVQRFFKEIGIFNGEIGKINKKQYLELENKFLKLSKKLKIPPEELDIAIWLYESGQREFYG